MKSIITAGIILSLTILIVAQEAHDLYRQQLDNGNVIEVLSTDITQKADIKATLYDSSGRILWSRIYGGTSYEKAGGVCQTADGGFVIVGSTSSYGVGNYDAWLIKTDADGKKVWERTVGEFMNDYGYLVAELDNGNLIIEGRHQECEYRDQGCIERPWVFVTDPEGNVINREFKSL
jgi:hypothetical protein